MAVEYPYLIEVNKVAQVVTVYTIDEQGLYTIPVKRMICSTGVEDEEFPEGVYPLRESYTWRHMNDGTYGKYATRISGQILFHSVPYERDRSNALIAEKYLQLGENESSGCVRLLCKDAQWIQENCPRGTPVRCVKGWDAMEEIKRELLAAIPPLDGSGWDPTDPDPDNPAYVRESATPLPTRVPWVTPQPDQFAWAEELE